ncbi:hypothetical protein FCV44_06150 [Vibrio kanaloae]|uniref:hypothetical protein n=1 Tax=Vibrio kanaloae TaxID=170673 RepID=UPI0010BE3304|nr:hypothetical protein [Vibrio kanaloae]TKE99248.1 hypothetical protein FCV44_06150 [Vibrio kanaloae]
MKDSDITVIDAIKNTKLSSIKKLVWMLWRLFALLSLLTALAVFYNYTLGGDSVIFYSVDEWDISGLLVSFAGIVLSLSELKTGSVSAAMIKFLTKNPNVK